MADLPTTNRTWVKYSVKDGLIIGLPAISLVVLLMVAAILYMEPAPPGLTCDLNKLNLPGRAPDSIGIVDFTGERLHYAFQDRPALNIDDWLMNFSIGPGHGLDTPGRPDFELSYYLLQGDPELSSHFTIEDQEAGSYSAHWAAPKDRVEVCRTLTAQGRR